MPKRSQPRRKILAIARSWRREIESKANAFGKAKGYANGFTTTGKIELQVAINML